MTYKEENDKLYNDFLNEQYYQKWAQGKGTIEFIFSPYCDLQCKYCYLNNYYDKQFPIDTFNPKESINNALKICQWLVDNNYKPSIDIFSGELFAQESGFTLLEALCNFYKNIPEEKRIDLISIPTNATFCGRQDKIDRVEKLLADFRSIGISIGLSFSVDGLYFDNINRPAKTLAQKDYDNIFSFAKRNNCSFHPMIYSNGIENWIDNFNWYQEQFAKYDIDWRNLYLLQVRNKEWTREQDKELYKFLRYIINWTWKKCNKNKKEYISFLKEYPSRGFNILNWLFNNEKGYGCSIQKYLSVRLNDMKIFPCHRLMYPDFEIAQYKEDMNVSTKNAPLGIQLPLMETRMAPLCSNCDINELCFSGCLGSQYETTKSILTPIPTVCLNFIYIFKAMVDGFEEIGIIEDLINQIPSNKIEQVKMLRRLNIDEL